MPYRDAARKEEHDRFLRQRHASRLAQGLCTRCGRVPPEPGLKVCGDCAEKRRAAERARRARAREQGKPHAGRNPERCRRADERMEQMDGLLEDWSAELVGVQLARPKEVLRLFAGNPFWTVSGVDEELGVAYTTAQRAIERLQVARIVSLAGSAKRNRVYCARDMLEVLEAPRAAARSLPEASAPSARTV